MQDRIFSAGSHWRVSNIKNLEWELLERVIMRIRLGGELGIRGVVRRIFFSVGERNWTNQESVGFFF